MAKRRKPKPSVPDWVYTDRDYCWFCKNQTNCGNCRANKDFVKSSGIVKFKGRKSGKTDMLY